MARAERLARQRELYRANKGSTIRLTDNGTIAATRAGLGAIPAAVEVARKRALAKLRTFVQGQVAKVLSAKLGIPQKTLKALGRVRGKWLADGSLEIWIGTNPLDVQYLGAVRWNRRMTGARAGRRLFPGTWSWAGKPGAKTGSAVMYRTGHPDAYTDEHGVSKEGIARRRIDIHNEVLAELDRLSALAGERFQTLMAQELRYALRSASPRAAA